MKPVPYFPYHCPFVKSNISTGFSISIIVLTRKMPRDTFVGNYAAEYIRQKQLGEWDISKAVARACKASARTIERLGAQESIPWADETDR